ncbi:hypothetical protein AvCA_03020 [Azotobacter vinelandii CA]|uniref:DUF4426 domain-containing protein n=2 Tax=Azotobacter vinelandii TaxID=354 RepID=C1DI65_AZOVD|nr:DUF4426 domain-containing protein [Azotobacter vinelandii]ACO76562.1 conserved hypothetical protein [Azotobacter vinelandii DJ]AGK17358.1 hypothetical protein AvCA_03020 [Azotobacter vinelandii CA]AGK19203.1 hypothetical protein AvCA6_03020 [Azotobacter vinelandii CA6]SFX10901.1 protein of unknown function [Azotobacter vinelandii]GLK58742.1 hypothetical protein GCM10017624_08990 [Azotobacter vinelandii]
MRRPIPFLLALCLSLSATAAERLQKFADLDVHYSAFNSGFLQPEIASAAGIVRGKTQGVLNISVLKSGKAQPATIKAQVRNNLGQVRALSFREVREDEAIYYLSQFPFDKETLHFKVDVQSGGGPLNSFEFDQEFFPDE